MQHSYPVRVSDIRRESPDCVSVAFDIPSESRPLFAFKAGQYVNVIKTVNGEELHRSYSICTGPEEGELRIAVKKVEGGKFSTYANESLRVGDMLELMPPNGRFTCDIRSGQKKSYLFIAAGSGITPVMSLIRTVLTREPESMVSLLYGNSSVPQIIFRDSLLDLKNKYRERLQMHFILSREKLDEDWFMGRISGEKLRKFAGKVFFPRDLDEVFICGPESMAIDCSGTLQELGISQDKIHTELFGTELPAMVRPKPASRPGESAHVVIRTDGRTTEFELPYGTHSILEAALDKQLNLPFACKGGVCCTCKARLLEGEVDMLRNYGLEPEEIRAGYILTCQAYPKSDLVRVDFDQ